MLSSPYADCCRPSTCATIATSTSCAAICVGDLGIYDTLAQLKAAPADAFPSSAPKFFVLRGLDVIYDGGYRLYVSDPTNGDPPDDYQTVEAANFSGRLKLLFG